MGRSCFLMRFICRVILIYNYVDRRGRSFFGFIYCIFVMHTICIQPILAHHTCIVKYLHEKSAYICHRIITKNWGLNYKDAMEHISVRGWFNLGVVLPQVKFCPEKFYL